MTGLRAQFILSRYCRELQRELKPVLAHPSLQNLDYQSSECRKAILEATDKFLTHAMQLRQTVSSVWELTKSDSDRIPNHLFARFLVGFSNSVVPLGTWNSFLKNPEIPRGKWSEMEADGFTLESCLDYLSRELQKYSLYFEGVDLDNPGRNAP